MRQVGPNPSQARARLLPPALVALLLVAMTALRLTWPGPVFLAFPWTISGLAVAAAGLAITLASARRFHRLGTNIRTFDEPGRLVDGGLFRLTRNPMYLGFLLLLLGAAVALGAASPFVGPALFFTAADRWYIPFEEGAMARAFGAEYEAYRRRVRRWI